MVAAAFYFTLTPAGVICSCFIVVTSTYFSIMPILAYIIKGITDKCSKRKNSVRNSLLKRAIGRVCYNRLMIQVKWIGRIPYAQAWDTQKELVAEMRAQGGDDQLLLLEHDPVYTLGRSGQEANLLLDEAARRQAGIALYWVDRGGDITYHGPGQLVGYPILNIKRLHRAQGLSRPDLHLYLRQLEDVIIGTLAEFDITGRRYPGYTGVWVDTPAGPRKIAAIGVKVNAGGITSHGFALNVDPDLSHFAGIIPCGIQEHGVTSMAQLLPRPVTITSVLMPLIDAFTGVFPVETRFVSPLVYA